MSRAYKCDRCGSLFSHKDSLKCVEISYDIVEEVSEEGKEEERTLQGYTMELCYSCSSIFLSFTHEHGYE